MADKIMLETAHPKSAGMDTWTLTGGSFSEMLSAVKAMPGRRYNSCNRTWVVTPEQAEQLMARFASGRQAAEQAAAQAKAERQAAAQAQAAERRAGAATDRQIAYIQDTMSRLGHAWKPLPGLTMSQASAIINQLRESGDAIDVSGVSAGNEVY